MSIPGSASPLFFTAAADAAAAGPIKSVRFNPGDNAHLDRTPSSAGNQRTFTIAFWAKLCDISSNTNYFYTAGSGSPGGLNSLEIGIDLYNRLFISEYGATLSDYFIEITSAYHRDPSAWYHFIIAVDTTQSTATDRVKFYVNGVEQDKESTSYPFTQNRDTAINGTSKQTIGSDGASDLSGYLADFFLIDGSQKEATDFGAFDDNGVWQAAAYSGTFGTNGFHLFDFANESGIGNDSSGNDNDFTVNNISSTAGAGNDVLRDVPTNGSTDDDTGAGGEVSGNYCTLNPLQNIANDTFSQGNLQVATNTSNYGTYTSTMATPLSGKWYAEVTIVSESGYTFVGLCSASSSPFTTTKSLYDHDSVAYYGRDGSRWIDGSSATYGATYTTGDIIGIAYDADAGSVAFYKNGSSQGTITSVPVREYFFAGSDFDGGSSCTYVWNFGQRAFAYSAPSGYKALCTTNLPTPTIADGSDYFDAVNFTGTGAAQTITGLEFQPDFTWIKVRDNARSHFLFDANRGATEYLLADTNGAEVDDNTTLTAFTSDGFSVGTSADVNRSTSSIISYSWKAAGSAVSNSDGSITTSVRANATAGFSIVSYTSTGGSSATIGHGLNAAPDFVLCKRLDAAGDWWAGHVGAGWTRGGYLQVADSIDVNSNWWNDTAPTSSVVTLGSYPLTGSSGSYVAFCFSSVSGYSAFGSYEGTGSGGANGPFVGLDFQPAFILIKSVDYDGNWFIYDNERHPNNPKTARIFANTSGAESAVTDDIDFLANGFKIRTSSTSTNGSGNTHIYAAFAENPLQANGGLAR